MFVNDSENKTVTEQYNKQYKMKWTIYNILFRFLVQLLRFDPFWALGGTCYATNGWNVQIFENELQHWIPPPESSINNNLQHFIPFSYGVIKIWPFLDLWGNLASLVEQIFKISPCRN